MVNPQGDIFKIYIKESIKNKIISEFNNSLEKGYCLDADYDSEGWHLNYLREPHIISNLDKNISFLCPKNSIMRLHTHPNKICKFSAEDIFNFGYSSKDNGYLTFYGLYCGQFVIIDKDMNNYGVF